MTIQREKRQIRVEMSAQRLLYDEWNFKGRLLRFDHKATDDGVWTEPVHVNYNVDPFWRYGLRDAITEILSKPFGILL